MNKHLQKFQALLQEKALDCVIVSNLKNLRYASGFSGSAAILLVFADKAILFTDFRYMEQAAQESPDCEIVQHGGNIYADIAKATSTAKSVGYEESYVTVETFAHMQKAMPDKKWLGLKLDGLRMIKDEQELSYIEEAVRIADAAFSRLLPQVRLGMTELEAAALLEYYIKQCGGSKTSFPTIVASGKRSSLPHGQPTDKKIDAGEFVLFDFGAVYEGYCSDITRTVVMGEPDDKQREIYDLVLKAQMAAINALKPGITGSEGDSYARNIIADAGYGDMFGHGTGHSLGLNIHEEPRLSPANKTILQPNMLLTVEPGVYIPDWGGVRIEDLLVVTEEGARILTQTDKQLLQIQN